MTIIRADKDQRVFFKFFLPLVDGMDDATGCYNENLKIVMLMWYTVCVGLAQPKTMGLSVVVKKVRS